MHNLSDEELDRLSREAAELNQTPIPPANWDLISSRLDREMPLPYTDRTWYMRIISDLVLLLAFFILGINYLSGPSKQNAMLKNTGEKVKESTTEVRASADSEKNEKTAAGATIEIKSDPVFNKGLVAEDQRNSVNVSTLDNTTGELNKTNIIADKKIGSKTKDVAGTDLSKRNNVKNNIDKNLVPQENDGLDNISDAPAVQKQEENKAGINPLLSSSGTTVTPQKNNPGSPTVQNDPDIIKSENENGGNKKSSGNEGVIENKSDPLSGLSAAAINETATNKSKSVAGKSRKKNSDGIIANRLEMGITWSPDFSKVGNTKAVSTGSIMGITAGYQLNKRWSVQTAILYTNKYYTAIGDEYGKIPGYNPNDPYIKIKKVNAECFMWDIPLNIRYNWLVKRNRKAFVSTGFSSYFMKKEDMHYWYTHYNNPRYKQWTNEESSSYWFAVGNISAGFEQFITPSISIQAEPFFKFSLRDIGYGKVNLKSSGIFLGLKYTPPLHQLKK